MKRRRATPLPTIGRRRRRRAEDQVHHRDLDEHGVERIDPGEDEPGHGARQGDEADGLRRLDLGGERDPDGGPDVRAATPRPRLTEGEAGLDLEPVVGELGHDPPGGRHGRRHGVADHHPGEGDDGDGLEREHPEPEEDAEGARRWRRRGRGGRSGNTPGTSGARARTVTAAMTTMARTHTMAKIVGASSSRTRREGVAHGDELHERPRRRPHDRALDAEALARATARWRRRRGRARRRRLRVPMSVVITAPPRRRPARPRRRGGARRGGSGGARRPSPSGRRRRTWSSSAMRSAWPRSWVTHTTATPSRGEHPHSGLEVSRVDRVERRGGLVEQQHLGLGGERPRQAHALRLTARQVVGPAVEERAVEPGAVEGGGGAAVVEARGRRRAGCPEDGARGTAPGAGTPCRPVRRWASGSSAAMSSPRKRHPARRWAPSAGCTGGAASTCPPPTARRAR